MPPIDGTVTGLLGLLGITWGWVNLNHKRHLPTSGIIFLAGCALWVYALSILLPWSTR